MFLTNLQAAGEWFEILKTTDRSQTAVMNLGPGQASGSTVEAHPESDQILIVLEGEVIAEVADERARMRTGDVVVVPAGVHHRFRNDSPKPARTVSVYALRLTQRERQVRSHDRSPAVHQKPPLGFYKPRPRFYRSPARFYLPLRVFQRSPAHDR